MGAVVLFDIDGTLVDCGGAGRRSIELAFEHRYQRPDACQGIQFGGMTDRAIVRAGLAAIGATKLGKDPAACHTLIVGDTPRDIRAAHAIGARCLAVCTGRFQADELREAGATLVVESLASHDARRAIESVSAEA